MDFSQRNKKVAIARWKNFHNSQEKIIAKGKNADYWKSAVCGFLAGDGSIQVRTDKNNVLHHDIGFFPDDETMLKIYLGAMKLLYRKAPSIKVRDNVFIVRIFSKVIVEDILKNANFGIKRWNLPQNLFYNQRNKIAWLRAFFSAEAYVGQNQIKLQTVNKEGMLEVSNLLNEFGIEHNCYVYPSKIKNQSAVSIISINKKGSRRLFLEKIGFWHSDKSHKLKKTLSL